MIIEPLLNDGTLDQVVKIALSVSGKYAEVFYESMFVLTNLITNTTRAQMYKFLNQDIVVLLVRVLEQRDCGQRLLMNVLESIHKFLRYDREVGLEGEASIKDFFEAQGGLDALNKLSDHSNFQVYAAVSDILDQFYRDDFNNDEIDYFFSQKYQSNTNIYDDTKHERSDDECDQEKKISQNNFII